MRGMLEPALAVAAITLGYLAGAVPVGLLVGRLTRGIDIREHGSQRTGATNALRTLGARAASVVFALDVLKGIVAVVVARLLVAGEAEEWIATAAGVAAIIGHNRSVFIGFTGGRGVATSAGALAALLPLAALIVVPVVALVILRWRYVSLGSIAGATAVPIIIAALIGFKLGGAGLPHLAYGLAAAGLVIAAHADNIGRLRAGTERRIGETERIDG